MFTNIFFINTVDVFKISHVIYLNSRCVGTFDIINWFHGESVYPLLSYHLYIKYIYNVVELFCYFDLLFQNYFLRKSKKGFLIITLIHCDFEILKQVLSSSKLQLKTLGLIDKNIYVFLISDVDIELLFIIEIYFLQSLI